MIKQFDKLDYDNKFSYNRFNYRANLDIDVTKTTLFKINIGGRVGVTHEPRGHSDGLWRQVNWASPVLRVRDLVKTVILLKLEKDIYR